MKLYEAGRDDFQDSTLQDGNAEFLKVSFASAPMLEECRFGGLQILTDSIRDIQTTKWKIKNRTVEHRRTVVESM